MIPVQITFQNFEPSKDVSATIEEKVTKLERFFDRIISCKVVVSSPSHGTHQRQQKKNSFRVHVYLSVPKHEIIVNREPEEHSAHEDIYVAIKDAFSLAGRQLEDYARKMKKEPRRATPELVS